MRTLHSLEGENSLCTADLNNNFNVLYYNARSLIPKMDELHSIVESQRPLVICIVETWLSDEIRDQEISLPGYQVIRLDRNRHGGGILIYVHNAITSKVLLSGPNELEFLAVSLCTPNSNRKHCVALLYRPPSSPVSFFDNFCSALHFLNPSQFSSFVHLGDFNIDFCSTHPYFCKLQSVTQLFSLSRVITTPTHLNSNGKHTIIDLVFVSHEQQISDCSVIAPLANSDHCGLRVTLSWKMPQRMTPMRPRTVWRYKDANFAKARDMIDAINWSSVLPMDNPDTAAMVWQNKFLDIIDECIPVQRLP